jgi:UDP-glucose/GDP-mannose dehydrogenase family, NAD binding domain/UDP-glucose/GDP-mannose dehydrogenase family, central domain
VFPIQVHPRKSTMSWKKRMAAVANVPPVRAALPVGGAADRVGVGRHQRLGVDLNHLRRCLVCRLRAMNDAARIAVIGSGYVGTVVASCFAWLGHDTVGVEVDKRKLEVLNAGHIPFYEPGLEDLVAAGLESCRLRFTDDYLEALSRVDAVFLCVGTPRGRDGSPDMRAIEAAGRAVGRVLEEPAIIVTKSTVPVGGAFRVRAIIEETRRRNGYAPTVSLVHNPEFLREGSAIRDFLHPDRVIVGSDETGPLETISRVYQPILDQSFPGGERNRIPGFLATDIITAETLKYASNAFLATKISFINEIACICDLVGANINDVAAGMGFDRRIAPEFLKAGIGWGDPASERIYRRSSLWLRHTVMTLTYFPRRCSLMIDSEALRSSTWASPSAHCGTAGSVCSDLRSSQAPTTYETRPPWTSPCDFTVLGHR